MLRKPDTVIVNELVDSGSAMGGHRFSGDDVARAHGYFASGHDAYYMQQALPPQHDARSDHEIFTGLARVLGFAEAFTETKVNAIGSEIWERSQSSQSSKAFSCQHSRNLKQRAYTACQKASRQGLDGRLS